MRPVRDRSGTLAGRCSAVRSQGQLLGFTLMEAMIVVMVLGILAAFAFPQYTRVVERSYWRSAQDVLQTIYAGEQVYEAANDTYVDPAACPTGPAWRCIYVDPPNAANIPVTYSVAAAATTFTATATRTGGGSMTIDQNRALDTSGWPMP